MSDSQALTVVPKQALTSLIFNSQTPIQSLEVLGTIAAKSGAFGFNNTQAGAVAVITCIETGITLTEYYRTYDNVDGKPRKKAAAALVEFERSGGKFEWLETGDEAQPNPDDQRAVLQLERGPKKIKYTYSMRDAKTEGLVKPGSRWTKRPGNMLRARCITNGLGIIAPEIFAGEYEDVEREAPELKLAPTAATVTTTAAPEPEKPAKVVEVEVVGKVSPPEDHKAEAAMGLAPLPKQDGQTPQTVSGPAPVSNAATSAATTTASGQSATPAANSSAPAATAEKFAKGPAYATPAGATLPAEMVDALQAAIGEHAVKAGAWMIKEGWLQQGQDLSHLTESRAKRILNQTQSFLRAIGGVQ